MGWDGDAAGALNWHLRPWDHLALRSSSTEGSPGREGDVATEGQRPLPAPPAHTQDGGRAFSSSSLPIIPRMRGLRVDVTRVVRACVRSAPRARNGSGIRWRQGRFRRGTRVGAAGGVRGHRGQGGAKGSVVGTEGGHCGGSVETLGTLGAAGGAGEDSGENGESLVYPGDTERHWRGLWAPWGHGGGRRGRSGAMGALVSRKKKEG